MDIITIFYADSTSEDVIVTQDAKSTEELMQSDYVALAWKSNVYKVIPAGSYINYRGYKYTLLDNYTPVQVDEITWEYKPEFQAPHMAWKKVPFFFYTYSQDGAISNRESDWSLTDTPANCMAKVVESIKNETGQVYTYAVATDLPASITVTFQGTDVFSGLNSIAESCETEWWLDKANRVLHLSRASHGDAVRLEVGVNINVPSVSASSDTDSEYYNRYYALGGTTNIPQDYQGAGSNNLINKRLTLDPAKYPGGYKDLADNIDPSGIYSKVLTFDDIYPKGILSIYDVRGRQKYVLDADTGDKVQIGTDAEGNPIYDQYTIWYFKVKDYEFNEDDIIEGQTLGVSFESGALSGRNFDLTYHSKAVSKNDASDVIPFQVEAGDFEILYTKEGDYIIPAQVGLVPVDGNQVVLLNIKMPEEAYTEAYAELEAALDKELQRRTQDMNSYTSDSVPQYFLDHNLDFEIGQNVIYVNGSYSFSTRITKIVRQLDFSYIQELTFGNETVKGTTQELREDVLEASKSIDILTALNELANKTQEAYARAQQAMLDGLLRISNMWMLDETLENTIRTPYSIRRLNIVESVTAASVVLGQAVLKWDDEEGALIITGIDGKAKNLIVSGSAGAYGTLSGDGGGTGGTTDYRELLNKPMINGIELTGNLSGSDLGLVNTADLTSYVTLGTAQTITGKKSFTQLLSGSDAEFSGYVSAATLYVPSVRGNKVYSLQVTDSPISGEAPAGGGTGIDEAQLWDILTDGAGGEVIGIGHIPTIPVSKISGLLGDNSKLLPELLPDYLMGQMLYGGTIDGTSVATLSATFKDRFGVSAATLTITTTNAASYEGVYFIASAAGAKGVVATLGVQTGDWVVSNGSAWTKIDNTDAVTSVVGQTGAVTAAQIISAIGVPNVSQPSGMFTYPEKTKLSGIAAGAQVNVIESIKLNGVVLDISDKTVNINAYSKTDADGRYVKKSGDTMSGDLTMTGHQLIWSDYVADWNSFSDGLRVIRSGVTATGAPGSYYIGLNVAHIDYKFQLATYGGGGSGILFRNYNSNEQSWTEWHKIWHSGNDGSGSGLDADLLDGTHKADLFSALSSNATTNLSVTIGGTTKSIADLYATYADQLRTAKTLWGQSFDGRKNVSGDMTGVGNVTMNDNAKITLQRYGDRYSNIDADNLRFDKSNTTGSATSEISVKVSDSSSYIMAGAYTTDNSLNRLYYGGTYSSPAMTILPSGNVGIGTTSPAYKLDVAGTGRFTSNLTIGGTMQAAEVVSNKLYVPSFAGTKVYDIYVSNSPVSGETPGAGGSGIDEAGLWNILSDGAGTEVINISHIPTIPTSKLSGTIDWDNVIGKPTATASVLGLVKAAAVRTDAVTTSQGGTTSGRYYGVEVDSNGKMFVNVPWVNTTYSLSSFGITATAAEINKLDGIGTLLHSGNYTSYTVTKTGGGASGTWGISISGNAATADISNYLFLHPNNGTHASQNDAVPANGRFAIYDVDTATTAGGNDGYIMAFRWPSGNWATQVYLDSDSTGIMALRHRSNSNVWTDWYRILHTGNYSSYLDSRYVKKSGDSMTGLLTISRTSTGRMIDLDSNNSELFVRFLIGSSYKGSCGYNSTYGTFLYNASGRYFGLRDDGSVMDSTGNKYWHSGNDGSGSGLDADLLDGTHKADLFSALSSNATTNLSVTIGGTTKSISNLYANYLDGNTIDKVRQGMSFLTKSFAAAGWYRVFTSSGGNANYPGEIILHIGRDYNSPQNEHYTFSICVGYNGYISITQLSGTMGGHLITKIRVVWDNSKAFYIDIYSAESSYENMYGVTGQGYGTFSAFTSVATIPEGYTAYEFTTVDGCKSDRGFTGTLSGNASSATKLQTARTLWGQSFDGRKNVSGDMTGVGRIIASGPIRTYSINIECNDTGALGEYDGEINRAGFTNPLYLQHRGGNLYICANGGNVGIGTTSTAYKLDVVGTGRFTSNLNVGGTVTASGNVIAYSSSSRQLKDIVPHTSYQQKLQALGRVVDYRYNNILKRDKELHTGLIYESVKPVMPSMCYMHEGYGALNYLSPDYINLIAGAVQEHTDEITELKRKIMKLESEIAKLRRAA